MSDLTLTKAIALVCELKEDQQEKHKRAMEGNPNQTKALPVPSIQIYGDGSIRIKRSDTEYMCPNIHPPYDDQKLIDAFDMVLSRGRKLIIDAGVSLGESLVLGENCRYVD